MIHGEAWGRSIRGPKCIYDVGVIGWATGDFRGYSISTVTSNEYIISAHETAYIAGPTGEDSGYTTVVAGKGYILHLACLPFFFSVVQ